MKLYPLVLQLFSRFSKLFPVSFIAGQHYGALLLKNRDQRQIAPADAAKRHSLSLDRSIKILCIRNHDYPPKIRIGLLKNL